MASTEGKPRRGCTTGLRSYIVSLDGSNIAVAIGGDGPRDAARRMHLKDARGMRVMEVPAASALHGHSESGACIPVYVKWDASSAEEFVRVWREGLDKGVTVTRL